MSINSMTGFARIDGMLPDGASLAWEVRSVNGRGLDLRLRMDAFKAALAAELDGQAIMPEGIHPSPWGVAFMGREYLRAAGLAPQLTNPAPYVDMLAANAGRLSQPCRLTPADKARPFIEAWIVP